MSTLPVYTYQDFVTWRRNELWRKDTGGHRWPGDNGGKLTVGAAMRYFTATSIETLLTWFERYKNEQEDEQS